MIFIGHRPLFEEGRRSRGVVFEGKSGCRGNRAKGGVIDRIQVLQRLVAYLLDMPAALAALTRAAE